MEGDIREGVKNFKRREKIGVKTYFLRMKRASEAICDWEACENEFCQGCGPSERLKTLITARPLCHVQLEVNKMETLCFLYDCADLYPDTQILLEPRLQAISRCKLVFGDILLGVTFI